MHEGIHILRGTLFHFSPTYLVQCVIAHEIVNYLYVCTDNNKNAHRKSIIGIVLLQSTYFLDQINVGIVSFGNVYEEGRTSRM